MNPVKSGICLPSVSVRVACAMIPALITAAIVAGYAFSLWWFLRREQRETLLWLALVCAASLCVRLFYTGEYPAGFNDDEPKILSCTAQQVRDGRYLEPDCTGLPALLNALFQGQLVPLFSSFRWPIRLYSLVTSVLATAMAFAAARAMQLRVLPSLAAAAFFAVAPWSIFWGRISMGGELPFHQLFLVTALARLIWAGGGAVDVAVGGFGLSLLLYDYFAGRAMVAMPLVGFVLARGRRRAACLAVLAVAVIGWLPYTGTDLVQQFSGALLERVDPGLGRGSLTTRLWQRTDAALWLFVAPKGVNGFLTIDSAAMHPPLLLALALIGSLSGLRRALFLWGGFVAGILPAIVSDQVPTSAHRMIMCFPFVSLAAGTALDLLTTKWLRRAVIVPVVAVISVQCLRLYFSDAFWERGGGVFFAEQTALVESIRRPHPRLIISQNVGYFADAHALFDPDFEWLTLDNWYPPRGPSWYAFGHADAALMPHYLNLFGAGRVQTFGRAFLVRLEDRDWSWLGDYGWAYDRSCSGRRWRGQVPTLHLSNLRPPGNPCEGLTQHVLRARWQAPPSTLVLRFTGTARVAVGGTLVAYGSGTEMARRFEVATGDTVEVRLDTDAGPGVWLALFELHHDIETLPRWDSVVAPRQVDAPGDVAAGEAPERTP